MVLVAVTGMRPDYDAFGWLVWGRQVLHWNLNTDGAPSWKPLTFLFTLPYALAGSTQVWLWTVTAWPARSPAGVRRPDRVPADRPGAGAPLRAVRRRGVRRGLRAGDRRTYRIWC